MIDRDFHMQYMSSAAINALQVFDISKYYGKKFPFDCYPEPHRTTIIENLEKIKETGDIVTLETPVFNAKGDELWFQSTFVPITDKDNCCESILIVSINITEQKLSETARINLEKRLRQSQTIEAIGLMAGGVAHDLNNILLAIVGYPDLILMNLPEDSKLRKPILAIKESGNRAATVVADLLTITRGAASTRETHDLHEIVAEFSQSPEAINLKVLYPKVTCQFRCDADRSHISCSPVHIRKCLMNLVTNAAESITDSGTVY
ncbi:PAS domain-containing protein, partial [Rhodopseudomonas palustris]|nr:PAS domain-containing protein [Rhodopseudomonas palustris]